ncbi:uncharacterized protein LOC117749943 [Cyclopterus lumpus]|uniref:uncharacterized protein LOC117749943 n=1 Tax=Cyclopterus lumpus TaxID=8103 RepID=UPI001486E94C|nr:uncharacterized protein LOC117749943 [Cyclopterus lumpus]
MSDNERKRLVWTIKKGLHHLSAEKIFELTQNIGPIDELQSDKLDEDDEESCFEYLSAYMSCNSLLTLEDEGMSWLLDLKDKVDQIIECHSESPEIQQLNTDRANANDYSGLMLNEVTGVNTDTHGTHTQIDTDTANADNHEPDMQKLLSSYEEIYSKLLQLNVPLTTQAADKQVPSLRDRNPPSRLNTFHSTPCLPNSSTEKQPTQTSRLHIDHSPHYIPQFRTEQPTHASETMIALRDLPLLQRREFKIHGGQIGDTASDMSYNSICKQVEEGQRERHTENEIIKGVLRIIKPGNFRDMLTNKEEMTVSELKSFLQSHLGERGSTELFQELMCAKQHEHETPQQFLYRTIGLKQKIMFTSRQSNSVVKYDASTVQCVFLNTIYQGLGEKHEDVRRDLKPLLSDSTLSDESILRQVIQTTNEESERKRRLGRSSIRKVTQAHSTHAEPEKTNKGDKNTETENKDKTIQRLAAQVETLNKTIDSLKQLRIQTQASEQPYSPVYRYTTDKAMSQRKKRPFGCPQCVEQGLPNCSHCFACGGEGHRAVGCLKKPKAAGKRASVTEEGRPVTTFKTKSHYSDVLASETVDVRSGTSSQLSNKTPPVTDKVAPLIGRRSLLRCSMAGYAVTVLLDTGANVSIIDRTWKEKYLPCQDTRPLSELIDKELDVLAITGDEVPYDGWVEPSYTMTKEESLKTNHSKLYNN